FLTITMVTPFIGLASNLATGFLASRVPLGRLLAVAMLGLGMGLAAFPLVRNLVEVYAYVLAMGAVGGVVPVVFFAVRGRALGKAHVGKPEGGGQMLTVFASAVGPLLLALSKEQGGSYTPLFYAFAPVCVLLGVAVWFTRAEPRPQPLPEV